MSFHFHSDEQARDVYESIRSLTCKLGRIEKLYAFSYRPSPPEREFNGWEIYDVRQEFARMGVSEKSMDRGWRISEVNEDYQVEKSTHLSLLAELTMFSAVLSHLSQNSYCAFFHFRQYLELCGKIPITWEDSSLDIPTSRQQLLHY